jgi:hypothetical protein
MSWYIVTLKLPPHGRAPHDPKNKQTGPCTFSFECTDVTGAHHSVVFDDEGLAHVKMSSLHVTRVELIPDNVINLIRKSTG